MRAIFLLGNGQHVLFWTDWWLGEGPLAVRFHRLFDICNSKEKFVAQVLPLTPISLQLRRSFYPEETQAWDLLVQETQHMTDTSQTYL
jgi:hypothetical protein